MRILSLAALGLFAACTSPPVRGAPTAAQSGCEPRWEGALDNTVRNLVADRAHENRFRLPWTDSLAPVPIRDPDVCARAGRAYADLRDERSPAPPAGVIKAGGLYFVIATPAERAGEWMIIWVLDAQFRRIVGITT
jgi:hypothetical protein